MLEKEPFLKILLVNQCANNKGDRTVLLAVLRELSCNGATKVWVSTDGPGLERISDYRMGMDISFIPSGARFINNQSKIRLFQRAKSLCNRILLKLNFAKVRKFLIGKEKISALPCQKDFRKALQEADVVISTGGHHITSLLVPDVQSAQMYDICLAVAARKRISLWSQTIGPMKFANKCNSELVKEALHGAESIYVRDDPSWAEVIRMGVPAERISQTPDSVFALNNIFPEYTKPSARGKMVGISVYHVMKRTPEAQRNYINSLAILVDHIVELGYTPYFLPMEAKGFKDDRHLIAMIRATAKYGDKCIVQDEDLEPREHIVRVSECRLFVGHKTHSVIMALTVGTPLVAISYHSKFEEIMKHYGQSDYCISDTVITGEALIRLFAAVDADCDRLGECIFETSRQLAQKVQCDFKKMVNGLNG